MAQLYNTEYNERYYEEHVEIGVDYLEYGFWQASYTKMVTEVTLQSTYETPAVFDAGCACGAMLNGFRETGIFDKVVGIDITEHMVRLGREKFGFSELELVAGSIERVPADAGSLTLVHSHQVLEHIPEEKMPAIVDEFARVLMPGGRGFFVLDAMRHGEGRDIYMGDPTHVNIQPVLYWTRLFEERGLLFDVETYNRFVRSPAGPTDGEPASFFQTYPFWSAWAVIKA